MISSYCFSEFRFHIFLVLCEKILTSVITFVNIMHGTVVSEVVATGTPLLQGPAHGYACLMQILNAHLVKTVLEPV